MYGQGSRPGSERPSMVTSAVNSGLSSMQASTRPSFNSRRPSMMMSMLPGARISGVGVGMHHGGPGARDIEFESVVHGGEPTYPAWWTRKRIIHQVYSLCEDPVWNSYICLMALMGIIWTAVGFKHAAFFFLDIAYNVCYAVHVFGVAYNSAMKLEGQGFTIWNAIAFLMDMITFSHYVSQENDFKLFCYYMRLHRPFSYLWALNENLKGSVLGNSLKFSYIFLVMRVTWALVWLNLDALEELYRNATKVTARRALEAVRTQGLSKLSVAGEGSSAMNFLSAFYLINKMFVPIGPSVPPASDVERVACLFIMLSGCLVVTAYAVASLSLVISLYMRPEESFRARYRLIIKEMEGSHIPTSEQERVETFYRMYWHKQRAVSETHLLPTFPPTLPATIFADIYFEAVQKSKILRDLSYQFISEMAKKMETIHYIPGDSIIKRTHQKSSYIYIAYGDIELVTAEDDSTAVLRLTRGTALTPCGVCAPAGLGRAHLEVRAATFCTAHVLEGADLWRVVLKHGWTAQENNLILGYFNDHLERVKIHHQNKGVEEALHKSSIIHFKRCLMALKEAKDAHGQYLLANTDILLEIAGCYIMRNRADATLTEESDAICLRPTFPCILQPTSSLLSAWNMFVAFLVIAVCFVHPYYLVFTKTVPIEFRFFDNIVTAAYVLDLVVHLSTGAHVEEGVPITFRQTSSQQMRSHWFVLDVLGTVPMFQFIGDGHFAGINKILRLPKVFRVLKEVEDSLVYHRNVLRFLSYTLLMFIACYLVAALQQGIMCFQFGFCRVANLTHSPFWVAQPIEDSNIKNRISFGLYWAVSMIMFTCHKEAGAASSWDHMLYTMVVLEVCILLRLFMEAVYSATILVTTSLREDYDANISIVKNFLIRNQVDPILRQRFIEYLQLCWFTDKAYSMTNKRSIFYDLPRHVYQDIVTRQRSKYILGLPFMKFIREQDLKEISASATLFYSSPNEIILNTGDISNEMYIIKQGICEIVSPDTKRCVGLLHVKCHFGVLVCLLRLPTYYTIRAVTHVQLFSIARRNLLEAIEKIPQMTDTMDFVKSMPEFQRLMLRRKPFLQYKAPAAIPNLARFPLPRKHEPDTDFLMPFYRLGFLSILRYIFPRYTIRPDGKYLIRYEWFRAFCAFASAVVFPSYTYLVLQWSWLWHIAMLLDLSAYYDIFQRMLIGYYNEMGILVFHPSSTAVYYIKGAFFTDLLACLPLENLESLYYDPGFGTEISFMKQFLMMNRLLQLYRLPSALTILKNIIERRDLIIVSEFIPLFIVWLTVLTSIIVGNSVKVFQQGEGQWSIIPNKDPGGSWVELFQKTFRFNITASPWNLLLASYFWVTFEVSTTGYNTINPSHWTLILVLFVGMLMGGMIITFYSVKIISMRANVNKALAEFQEHLKDMALFMKREGLNPNLQGEVLEYYEYSWDKMGGVDYRNMFKLCDLITLRTDAILHIYGPTFTRCPILSHTDISLMRIVGRAVNSAYFLRGMNIIETDDVISDMYFVDYGGVDAREDEDDVTRVVKLPRGSVFGNLDGEPYVRCRVSFVATSRAHLLMINSETFHQIILDFPAVQLLMRRFRTKDSYIMGDVADTYAAAQQRSQASSPMVISSRKGLMNYLFLNDKYIQIYLIIVSLLCVYIDEYNLGFQDNSMSLIITLYVLDLCFVMKILLNCILPVLADSANIKKILIPVRQAYLHGEFRYDLLSCLPFELVGLSLDIDANTKWMVFSALRMNRMFRIITVYNCIKRHHERITVNLILTTAFSAFTWFALFVHTTACIWYFIGSVIDERYPRTSWIYKDDGSSWCDNRYICSLYFVLTTFTQNGVGDIMPKHRIEVMFVIILQIISTMLYMIYVGEFSNVIQYQSFRSFSFYSKYLELQEFMVNNRVSKNLVTLVQQYGLHLWRETRGMQAPHFLLTAPQSMKLQIMSACYLHHLTRHHVFELCEPAFLRQLVGCLQLLTYNEDMYVVKSSEITDSMYLIHTGKIEEIAEEKHKVPRIYPAGSYFGVLQGLVQGIPFTHSYRTLIKSQVLTLRLDDWKYLLDHYPFTKDAIRSYMSPIDDKPDDGPSKPKSPRPPKSPPKPRSPDGTKMAPKRSPLSSGPPDSKGSEEEAAEPKKSKFVLPQGPTRPKDDEGSVQLDPALFPLRGRDDDDDYVTEENKATQSTPASSAREVKYSASAINKKDNAVDAVKRQETKRKIKKRLSIVIQGEPFIPKVESNKSIQLQEEELANTSLVQEIDSTDKRLPEEPADEGTLIPTTKLYRPDTPTFYDPDAIPPPTFYDPDALPPPKFYDPDALPPPKFYDPDALPPTKFYDPDKVNTEKGEKDKVDTTNALQINSGDVTVLQENDFDDVTDAAENYDENIEVDDDDLDDYQDKKVPKTGTQGMDTAETSRSDIISVADIPIQRSELDDLTHTKEVDAGEVKLEQEMFTPGTTGAQEKDTIDLTQAEEKDAADVASIVEKDATDMTLKEERYITDLIFTDDEDVGNVAHIEDNSVVDITRAKENNDAGQTLVTDQHSNVADMTHEEKDDAHLTFKQVSDVDVVTSMQILVDTEKQILEPRESGTLKISDSYTSVSSKNKKTDDMAEAEIRREQERILSIKAQPSELKQMERTEFIEKHILNQLLNPSTTSRASHLDRHSEEHLVTVDITTRPSSSTQGKMRESVGETYSTTNILPYISVSVDRFAHAAETSPRETFRNAPDKSSLTLEKPRPEPKRTLEGNELMSVYDEPELLDDEETRRLAETRDQDTSTSKMNRRLIRVRYEDDRSKKESADIHAFARPSAMNEMSITERNMRMMDSDMDNAPVLVIDEDEEADGNESSGIDTHGASSISLMETVYKKKTRPRPP